MTPSHPIPTALAADPFYNQCSNVLLHLVVQSTSPVIDGLKCILSIACSHSPGFGFKGIVFKKGTDIIDPRPILDKVRVAMLLKQPKAKNIDNLKLKDENTLKRFQFATK